MKFFTNVVKWMKGQDLSKAKANLAEDARKWGNSLMLMSIASFIFSEKSFLLILGKMIGLDAAPVFAVTHPWLVFVALGVGIALRVLSFVLDMNPKSKESLSAKNAKKA